MDSSLSTPMGWQEYAANRCSQLSASQADSQRLSQTSAFPISPPATADSSPCRSVLECNQLSQLSQQSSMPPPFASSSSSMQEQSSKSLLLNQATASASASALSALSGNEKPFRMLGQDPTNTTALHLRMLFSETQNLVQGYGMKLSRATSDMARTRKHLEVLEEKVRAGETVRREELETLISCEHDKLREFLRTQLEASCEGVKAEIKKQSIEISSRDEEESHLVSREKTAMKHCLDRFHEIVSELMQKFGDSELFVAQKLGEIMAMQSKVNEVLHDVKEQQRLNESLLSSIKARTKNCNCGGAFSTASHASRTASKVNDDTASKQLCEYRESHPSPMRSSSDTESETGFDKASSSDRPTLPFFPSGQTFPSFQFAAGGPMQSAFAKVGRNSPFPIVPGESSKGISQYRVFQDSNVSSPPPSQIQFGRTKSKDQVASPFTKGTPLGFSSTAEYARDPSALPFSSLKASVQHGKASSLRPRKKRRLALDLDSGVFDSEQDSSFSNGYAARLRNRSKAIEKKRT
ncbi:hypothetical protein IE53DRAFT_388497 [Violaceomyces palustris]|uniref:Uncharacterized protein n=1 Tax=Violaceomyces palustris TaxID=1673888 RepID=A0ACD0NTY2_9BASI|nr:hypothetical protein IE53DRAFT_388497 [Violaceomyces palustris]